MTRGGYGSPSALETAMAPLVAAADAGGLAALVASLPHSRRRTAAALLAERLLPGVDEEAFWRLFEAWVPQGVKALLGTFLKAAALRYRAGRLSLADGRLHRFAREVAGSVDKQKLLAALMPVVRSGDDALRLLALAEGLPLAPLARTLMRCGTPPAYFCLLRALQSRDAPPQTLRACCLMLMKEGSRLAFNMASIVAAYFGLDALPGTFSLALPPYELSRLDASYEQFEKLLLRV